LGQDGRLIKKEVLKKRESKSTNHLRGMEKEKGGIDTTIKQDLIR
jgi:hypothetical protein